MELNKLLLYILLLLYKFIKDLPILLVLLFKEIKLDVLVIFSSVLILSIFLYFDNKLSNKLIFNSIKFIFSLYRGCLKYKIKFLNESSKSSLFLFLKIILLLIILLKLK